MYNRIPKSKPKIALSCRNDSNGKKFRMKECSLYVGECQGVNLVGIVLYTSIIHACVYLTGVAELHSTSVHAPWYTLGISDTGPVSPACS